MASLAGTYLTAVPEGYGSIFAGNDLISIFIKSRSNVIADTGAVTVDVTNLKDNPGAPVINFNGTPFYAGAGAGSGHVFRFAGRGNFKILTARTTAWGTNVVQRWKLRVISETTNNVTEYLVDDINSLNEVKGGYCIFDIDVPTYDTYTVQLICLTSGWDFIDCIIYEQSSMSMLQWNATYWMTQDRINPLLYLCNGTLQQEIQPVIPYGNILRFNSGKKDNLLINKISNYEVKDLNNWSNPSRFNDTEVAYMGHIKAKIKFTNTTSIRVFNSFNGVSGQGTVTLTSTDNSVNKSTVYTLNTPNATYRNWNNWYRDITLDKTKTYILEIYSEYGYTGVDYFRIDDGGIYLPLLESDKVNVILPSIALSSSKFNKFIFKPTGNGKCIEVKPTDLSIVSDIDNRYKKIDFKKGEEFNCRVGYNKHVSKDIILRNKTKDKYYLRRNVKATAYSPYAGKSADNETRLSVSSLGSLVFGEQTVINTPSSTRVGAWSIDSSYGGVAGGDGTRCYSATAGDTMVITVPVGNDKCAIYTQNFTGGSYFKIYVDGVYKATASCYYSGGTMTTPSLAYTVTGLDTSVSHTVKLECVNSGYYVIVYGFICTKPVTDAKYVNVEVKGWSWCTAQTALTITDGLFDVYFDKTNFYTYTTDGSEYATVINHGSGNIYVSNEPTPSTRIKFKTTSTKLHIYHQGYAYSGMVCLMINGIYKGQVFMRQTTFTYTKSFYIEGLKPDDIIELIYNATDFRIGGFVADIGSTFTFLPNFNSFDNYPYEEVALADIPSKLAKLSDWGDLNMNNRVDINSMLSYWYSTYTVDTDDELELHIHNANEHTVYSKLIPNTDIPYPNYILDKVDKELLGMYGMTPDDVKTLTINKSTGDSFVLYALSIGDIEKGSSKIQMRTKANVQISKKKYKIKELISNGLIRVDKQSRARIKFLDELNGTPFYFSDSATKIVTTFEDNEGNTTDDISKFDDNEYYIAYVTFDYQKDITATTKISLSDYVLPGGVI